MRLPSEPSTLLEVLEELRPQLAPGDCIAICPDGSVHSCRRRCPGPDEPGSVCFNIEADDPRSSAEIAVLFEKPN